MAKLTWLGTDGSVEGDEYVPLSPCTWCGVFFPVGQAVEVTDETMIRKARGNRFFRVDDAAEAPAKKPEPEQSLPIGLIRPEAWTNTPPPADRYPDLPPDYPPEDDPQREPRKRGGRPKRVRDNGDGD